MQPDTPCHYARSASWETGGGGGWGWEGGTKKGRGGGGEKTEEENRKKAQASEKVFLTRVATIRGVGLFLRKAVLPAKAKNKDTGQKKKKK